jgi:hypothetical protein
MLRSITKQTAILQQVDKGYIMDGLDKSSGNNEF